MLEFSRVRGCHRTLTGKILHLSGGAQIVVLGRLLSGQVLYTTVKYNTINSGIKNIDHAYRLGVCVLWEALTGKDLYIVVN